MQYIIIVKVITMAMGLANERRYIFTATYELKRIVAFDTSFSH